MKKILFISIVMSAKAIAGQGSGIGGGASKEVLVESSLMREMIKGIGNDEVIMMRTSGETVYLEPLKESIQSSKVMAKNLPSGELVTFYVPSESQAMASKVSLNFARAVKASIPGLLPAPEISITEKPVVRTIPRNQAE